jgi:hypothetical protein
VTTDDGTGLVHQSPAFGADDLAFGAAYGLPVVTPVRTDARSRRTCRWSGQFFQDGEPRAARRPRRARAAAQARAVRARLPALLALRHARCSTTRCRPGTSARRRQGPPARGERAHRLAPETDPARPLRRLARQQHRLGAVAQPLLGARRCRSGAAPPTRATGWSSRAWPTSARAPGRTCPRSTRTGRSSTTSSCRASSAAPRAGGCPR